MAKALDLCRAVRADNPDVPVVLFGYANPIFVRGTAKFAAKPSRLAPTEPCAWIGRPMKIPD